MALVGESTAPPHRLKVLTYLPFLCVCSLIGCFKQIGRKITMSLVSWVSGEDHLFWLCSHAYLRPALLPTLPVLLLVYPHKAPSFPPLKLQAWQLADVWVLFPFQDSGVSYATPCSWCYNHHQRKCEQSLLSFSYSYQGIKKSSYKEKGKERLLITQQTISNPVKKKKKKFKCKGNKGWALGLLN